MRTMSSTRESSGDGRSLPGTSHSGSSSGCGASAGCRVKKQGREHHHPLLQTTKTRIRYYHPTQHHQSCYIRPLRTCTKGSPMLEPQVLLKARFENENDPDPPCRVGGVSGGDE
jgi:hypothetical protein